MAIPTISPEPERRVGAHPPRLILASNRLPVTVRRARGKVTLEPSSGGLATALRRLHERTGGVWVGWPGDAGRISSAARSKLAQQLEELRCVPVSLSSAEVTRYYDGFANGVLWPLFHYLLDKVNLDADQDYAVFEAINRRFAERVAEQLRPHDVVWIHDYQLALVPGFLRELVPSARIGFFLHIPFPSSEVFRILPWREAFLRSLLAADLVGFHTASYRQHFARAAAEVLDTELAFDDVLFEDRCCRLGVYPISIETAAFEAAAALPEVEAEARAIREAAQGKRIVLGVDRLDYTKGIPRRLLALNRALTERPELRERLHVIQVAVPSRENVSAYAELRGTVNELAGRINAHHGSPVGSPLQLLYRSVSFEQLVALYRAADVMLVTPLRDGMNLVAKEYVASRIDGRGALVLSEFAGAAAELREAILVNPYDLGAAVHALVRALEMPSEEQEARMQAMRAHVRAYDVHLWARRFVDDLSALRSEPSVTIRPPRPPSSALDGLEQAPTRVLLLDYDGTLVPHMARPELAVPDTKLETLLDRLIANPANQVHIVTGRDKQTIDKWFGHLPIALHAEHGLWWRPADGEWTATRFITSSWKDALRPVLEAWVERTPGALIEEKTATLGVHYRNADPALTQERVPLLREELRKRMVDEVEILDGAKVLEIRLRGVSKGLVAGRVAEALREGIPVLALGDDRTDEDLFLALPEGAVTVRVGSGRSHARFAVDGVPAARALLERLTGKGET